MLSSESRAIHTHPAHYSFLRQLSTPLRPLVSCTEGRTHPEFLKKNSCRIIFSLPNSSTNLRLTITKFPHLSKRQLAISALFKHGLAPQMQQMLTCMPSLPFWAFYRARTRPLNRDPSVHLVNADLSEICIRPLRLYPRRYVTLGRSIQYDILFSQCWLSTNFALVFPPTYATCLCISLG